jgi:hypothetical protein
MRHRYRRHLFHAVLERDQRRQNAADPEAGQGCNRGRNYRDSRDGGIEAQDYIRGMNCARS